MKVTPGIAHPSEAAAPSGQRDAGDMRHQQWRAELERAQWQARMRYSPVSGGARGSAERSPAADTAAPAPARPAGSFGAAHGGLPAAQAASAAQRWQAAQASPAAQALPRPGATGTNAFASAGWAALQGRPPTAAASATRPAAALSMFDLPHWPAQVASVSVQGNRLSVVLRDARLEPAEWQHLRDRLRAHCERMGLEMAELTINGVPVEPVPPASQEGA